MSKEERLNQFWLDVIDAGEWSMFYQKRGDHGMFSFYHGLYLSMKERYFQMKLVDQ